MQVIQSLRNERFYEGVIVIAKQLESLYGSGASLYTNSQTVSQMLIDKVKIVNTQSSDEDAFVNSIVVLNGKAVGKFTP